MEEKRAQATTYLLEWRRRSGHWRLDCLGRDDASRRESSSSSSSSSSPPSRRCGSSARNRSDRKGLGDPIMVDGTFGNRAVSDSADDRIYVENKDYIYYSLYYSKFPHIELYPSFCIVPL